MRTRPVLVGALVAAILTACDESPVRDPDPESGTPVLLVVNSLGETLDRIDLETGIVQSNAAVLGSAPNDVLIDPIDGSVYVANSLSNTVTRLDGTTLELSKTFELGPDSNPYQLALLPNRDVAVTNFLANDVAWLDRESGAVIERSTVGRRPQAILGHDDRLYVGLVNYESGQYGAGELVLMGGGRVIVGTNPQDIVVGPDGMLHVVCTGNYETQEPAPTGVWIVDPLTLAVSDTIDIGGTPAAAAVSGNFVYVTPIYGGLMKYDGVTHELLRGPDNPVLDITNLGTMVVDEELIYIVSFPDDLVYVLDTRADTLVTAYSVGDGPVALARGTVR
jgi:DNA-binding beta-propeller fold protein YncE